MFSFGKNVRFTIFGQSHADFIGVVVDGLPAGARVDTEKLQAFLRRRAPNGGAASTPRKETDELRVLSGLVDGHTCGAPVCMAIKNKDMHSKDYEHLRFTPRPSHADYTAQMLYGGYQDVRGGGAFSGRMTAPLCMAGGIAKQLLEEKGIHVEARVVSIGGKTGADMEKEIEEARADGDSVGGVIECVVQNVPAGLGSPMMDTVEGVLSHLLFAIPAVRGVEFGAGFDAANMRGSAHNDPFTVKDGKVQTVTNHHGGVLGGITSGMPVVFRVAVKPTPSIGKTQKTVDLRTMQEIDLVIGGRHDACIVPRAVPCVESAAALVILDFLCDEKGAEK